MSTEQEASVTNGLRATPSARGTKAAKLQMEVDLNTAEPGVAPLIQAIRQAQAVLAGWSLQVIVSIPIEPGTQISAIEGQARAILEGAQQCGTVTAKSFRMPRIEVDV